jgi:hypothetical protein
VLENPVARAVQVALVVPGNPVVRVVQVALAVLENPVVLAVLASRVVQAVRVALAVLENRAVPEARVVLVALENLVVPAALAKQVVAVLLRQVEVPEKEAQTRSVAISHRPAAAAVAPSLAAVVALLKPRAAGVAAA